MTDIPQKETNIMTLEWLPKIAYVYLVAAIVVLALTGCETINDLF